MEDPLELYVTGFGTKMTRKELKVMFPSAEGITYEDNKPTG